jgi:hypothetical protein
VVSAADWLLGRRARTGITGTQLAGYLVAQVAGAISGSVLANLMFALPGVQIASTARSGGHLWLGEITATAGLILLIFALVRTGRTGAAPMAVGAYIGAAYWFTSSTSFANPAVTVGRAFTDTFAGIAPGSVPAFIAAQLAGAALGVVAVAVLYPRATPGAESTPDRASAGPDTATPPAVAASAASPTAVAEAAASPLAVPAAAAGEAIGPAVGAPAATDPGAAIATGHQQFTPHAVTSHRADHGA